MKQKILIVDDKPENLYTLKEVLNEHLDVNVIEAASGVEALKHFLHNNFSLAILDVQMPEMDGYQLASYIRNRRESKSTPIIFLSAVYTDEFHVFKGYESGGVDFISKPFNTQLLINKVRFFIRLKDEQIKREEAESELIKHRDTLQQQIEIRTRDLQNAKADAEAANKAKTKFLATMSHEIRTPMHAMLGMTDLLLNTNLDSSQKDYARTIQEAGKLLVSIINDILDFSKIEAGKLELEKKSFNLADSINHLIALFKIRASEKGLLLNYHSSLGENIYLMSDQVRINQVLNNLINNAIKFTEKGSVTLDVKAVPVDGSHVRIKFRITDTGIGIPKQQLKKLFTPFTQAEDSITRRFGGTGLGLSIVKSIVTALNGNIYLRSAEGKGSLFILDMLFETGEMPKILPKVSISKKSDIADFPSGRILIVEDGMMNIKLISEILKQLKFKFDVAMNGKQALDLFEKNKYELILMDCHMPIMDGYTATAVIRENEATKGMERTTIIALTADALAENRVKCLSCGMDEVLPKPFIKKEFIDKITSFINAGKRQNSAETADQLLAADRIYTSIDLEQFERLVGDVGIDSAIELMSYFNQTLSETRQTIETMAKKQELEELSKQCHSIKGSSLTLGAVNLGKYCDMIAHHLKEMNKDEIETTIKKILFELDNLQIEVPQLLVDKS